MPGKTIEQLEADLAAAREAADVAETARRFRYEVWLSIFNEAAQAGYPPPAKPVEDWAALRALGRRRAAALATLTRARRVVDPTFKGGTSQKTTLRVSTPEGVFERTTSHVYTHVVLVRATEQYLQRAPAWAPHPDRAWYAYRWSHSLRAARAASLHVQRIYGNGGSERKIIEVATGREV